MSERYRLLDGRVSVDSARACAWTALGLAWWFGPPVLVARWLGRTGCRRALARLLRWWARGLAWHLRLRLELEGLEHVDPRAAYVVAPLHEGLADPLAVLHLPLRLRFAARDELFGWRVVGPALRDTGQVAVCPERGPASYRALLPAARRALAAGESVVVFPQGGILGIEADFLKGAFALARACGAPLLPVALTGSHRVWEHPFTPRLRYGQRVSLRVLPPLSAAEVQAHPADALRARLRRHLKAAALDGAMAPPRRFVPARDGFWDGYAYAIDPAFPALAAEVAAHRSAR